ncbi:MAG: acetolactate decarboxylase [Dehalococcoidales bacterium]|jgi:acetolactate decarboxylase
MFQRKKIYLVIIISLLCLLSINLAGCSTDSVTPEQAETPAAQRETLTQVSTIDAVLNGVYDGVMTYETLNKYGDFGIGTFEGLDGEMLAFDGNYYQIKADGIAYPVTDDMKTPFASVTFFDADYEDVVPEGVDYAGLEEFLDSVLPTVNTFYAIKIEGNFSYMKTRSVPAQIKPYPPLVEVTKNQPVFEFNNVEGVVVGFRCPPYVTGVNVPGYHLHFLTGDRDAGGHVLEFKVQQAVVSVDYTPDFLMILPDEESDFYKIDLSQDKEGELEKAEK